MIFHKYHGTGNDFILIDNRKGTVKLSAITISKLCRRHFGIGADGLILLESHPEGAFYMRYYNSDGNESTMCGNGGRCAVLFAKHLRLLQSDSVIFFAADGKHAARLIQNDKVSLCMNVNPTVSLHGKAYILDTGSPHYVRFTYNVDSIDVNKEGRVIRRSAQYNKEGINVNFVEEKTGFLYVRTYERGVEEETLSCGTGVTAVAMAYHIKQKKQQSSKTIIKTLGGTLEVSIEVDQYNQINSVWLTGEAQEVFIGEFNDSRL